MYLTKQGSPSTSLGTALILVAEPAEAMMGLMRPSVYSKKSI